MYLYIVCWYFCIVCWYTSDGYVCIVCWDAFCGL